MALEEKIVALISGSTITNTLLGGATSRVYPITAPQNPTYPFLVYLRVSGGQMNGLDGYLTLENPRIQIDSFSTSYSQVKTIAENVHTVMNSSTGFTSVLLSDNDLFEDGINIYSFVI